MVVDSCLICKYSNFPVISQKLEDKTYTGYSHEGECHRFIFEIVEINHHCKFFERQDFIELKDLHLNY